MLLNIHLGLDYLFVADVAFVEWDIYVLSVPEHYNLRVVILYYLDPAVVGNAYYCKR